MPASLKIALSCLLLTALNLVLQRGVAARAKTGTFMDKIRARQGRSWTFMDKIRARQGRSWTKSGLDRQSVSLVALQLGLSSSAWLVLMSSTHSRTDV